MAPHQLICFLGLVREARSLGRLGYRRDGRKVSMDTLAELGLSVTDVLDRVAALEPTQALNLPWENVHPQFPDELTCDFGIYIEEHGIYVKVTIGIADEEPAGCVISFHPQERPFTFPFTK